MHSGVQIRAALRSLALTSSGAQRRMLKRMDSAVEAGKTLGDAIAAERALVDDLEIGVVAACEKSGRLEYGMSQLSKYFAALAAAREAALSRCAYPVVMLHLAVFAVPLGTLINSGVGPYLRKTLGFLVFMWALVIIILQILPLARDSGARNSAMDRLLRRLPSIGGIRRAFATSRFCATYEMQLDAGINVIDALDAAQRASMSGLAREAVRDAIPEIRNGSQVGPLLATSGAFPEPMTRAILVGEQTGRLDQELTRIAEDSQAEAIRRLNTLAEWGPRLLYMGVAGYIGYSVVMTYVNYLNGAMKMLDM